MKRYKEKCLALNISNTKILREAIERFLEENLENSTENIRK